MNDPDTSTNELLVEQLAEEYLERLHNGERPSIRQYTQDYPELADEIRDLFNTLVMMEDLAPDPEDIADQVAPWPTEAPTCLGEYRILRELGRGGMGVVYEAEHVSMQRRVALKVLHLRAAKRGHDLERFMREARSAGRLHHTNIVPVFEVGSDDGTHFYAMQCIRGQNLDLIIADLKRIHEGHQHEVPHALTDESPSAAYGLLSGQFTRCEIDDATISNVVNGLTDDLHRSSHRSEQAKSSGSDSFTNIVIPDSSDMSNVGAKQENYFHRVARIGLQVADALSYAHDQGVLHRDIKPSNLILDTTGVIWVTDFGLARSEGEDLTHTGDIVGTLRYMAPERFQGEADARADIYSLGLTLYELCTLTYAFDRSDRAELIRQVTQQDPTRPRLVNASIPSDLETIVLKAIDREPNARYRSAAEMAEDLRLFLADRPIQARRASYAEQAWRWCRRNPGFASMLASITMLLAVVCCGSIMFALTTKQHAAEIEQKSRSVQSAHLDSRRSLFESYVDQAKASRWSGRRGQRFGTLDAVASATGLLQKLEFDELQIKAEQLALRNEAIAALPLTDIRITHSWPSTSTARCSLSDNGSLLAVPDTDGSITVYQIDSDRVSAKLQGPNQTPWLVQFDPTSRFLFAWFEDISAGGSPTALVWEIANGNEVIRIENKLDRGAADFDGEGRRIAIHRSGGNVDIFDLEHPEHVVTCQAGDKSRAIRFAPNGDLAVSVDKRVKFFSETGEEIDRTVSFPSPPRSMKFLSDDQIVVGCSDRMIYLHDFESGEAQTFDGHTGTVVFTNPSSDGRLLATEAWGGTRFLRDLPSGEIRLRLHGLDFGWGEFCKTKNRAAFTEPMSRHGVWEVAVGGPYTQFNSESILRMQGITAHPLEDSIVVVTGVHLEVWDFVRQRRLAVVKDIRATDAVFTPDGKRMYFGVTGKTPPQVCDFHVSKEDSTGDLSVQLGPADDVPGMRIHRPGGRSQHLAIDAAGRRLAALDHQGNARVVDLSNQSEIAILDAQPFTSRLAISPDGSMLATGTWHGKGVRVFDINTGQLIRELNPELTSAWVGFTPDGNALIVSSEEQDVVWDTRSWRSNDIAGDVPDGSACKIGFSPDGKLAAVAQSNFVRRLVDPASGEVVAVLEGPDPAAGIPTFSATSRYMIEAINGRLQVWDLNALRADLSRLGLDWE